MRSICGAFFFCWCACAVCTAEIQLDADISRIANFKALEDRQNLCMVQDRVRNAAGKPAEARHLEQQFMLLLNSPASVEAKEFACRQLALIGTERAVPGLALLLPEAQLSHMARYALERIPGSAAEKALRQALPGLGGLLKVGVINSLGARRASAAAPSLVKMLNDSDSQVVEAAAAALGKIGGTRAHKALSQARLQANSTRRPMLTDALLLLARHLVTDKKDHEAFAIYHEIYQDKAEPRSERLAALTGLISAQPHACAALILPVLNGPDAAMKSFALRFVRETSDIPTAQAFVTELPKLSLEDQVRIIGAMAGQQNIAARSLYRAAVVQAAHNQDQSLRVAAVKALGKLGTEQDLPLLLDSATSNQPRLQIAAREALDVIPSKAIDDALISNLAAHDADHRGELVRALGTRHVIASSAIIFLAARQDPDAEVRAAAFRALGALAQPKDLPDLLVLLKEAKTDEERREAETTAILVCEKAGNSTNRMEPILKAFTQESSPIARASLLRILGGIGGDAALAPVLTALKNEERTIRETAVRVMAEWPEPKPIEELLKLAQSTSEPMEKVIALRGYIRMTGLVKDCPAEKRMNMYATALRLAQRPEEKKMALGGLASVEDQQALKLIDPYLEDSGLQLDAASATLKIAFATRHKDRSNSLVAIDKVLKQVTNESLRAEALKDRGSIDLP